MPSHGVTISQRGAERIRSGHPWIYRSDVMEVSGVEPGAVVEVRDSRKHFLGQALYSSQSQIALRFLTRENQPFDRGSLAARISQAALYREKVTDGAGAYRLVASEADLLPGLIIDRYDECWV